VPPPSWETTGGGTGSGRCCVSPFVPSMPEAYSGVADAVGTVAVAGGICVDAGCGVAMIGAAAESGVDVAWMPGSPMVG
jgi:hypothetical protein